MANGSPSFFEKRRLRRWYAKRRSLGYETPVGTAGWVGRSRWRDAGHQLRQLVFAPLSTERALILGSILVAASILAHAWITRPPRYRVYVDHYDRQLWYINNRTGAVLQCPYHAQTVTECNRVVNLAGAAK